MYFLNMNTKHLRIQEKEHKQSDFRVGGGEAGAVTILLQVCVEMFEKHTEMTRC